MNIVTVVLCAVSMGMCRGRCHAQARVVFETTSPYHHIQVIDQQGLRALSFDGSMETRMSLSDPLTGHFEYIEYFHTPWLWHSNLTNVLMVGLGGGSVQRAYEHYYPQVSIDTVEIDAAVVRIAKEYFRFKESERQRVHVMDGRVYLRRTETKYDTIIMDAYVKNRYGSFIPYQLATKEFFEIARDHLTTNGVIAYNVIGTMHGWQADILGSVYKTMKSVFPNVYLFPAKETLNVVMIGTRSPVKTDSNLVQQRAGALIQAKRVTLSSFRSRVLSFRADPPSNFNLCRVLKDDFAPVDGLLRKGGR
jgi:spermidine synthase